MGGCDGPANPDASLKPSNASQTLPAKPGTEAAATRAAKPAVDDDAAVAAHATQPTTRPIAFDDSKWEPLFRGIDHRHIVLQSPRLMHVHAIRIDMRTPGLGFLITPPDPKTGMWSSMTTSHFVRKYKVQLGINGSAFSPVFDDEGQPQKVNGLTVCDGEPKGRFTSGIAALEITSDNHARVVDGKSAPDLTGVKQYISGFSLVLSGGESTKEKSTAIHPRTAAGATADGNTLYLVVVDGRQTFYSQGATTHDLGEIFKLLGAKDAVNLDGGGSTALVIQDKAGEPVQLNSPINHGVPGSERPVAVHLGVIIDPP